MGGYGLLLSAGGETSHQIITVIVGKVIKQSSDAGLQSY